MLHTAKSDCIGDFGDVALALSEEVGGSTQAPMGDQTGGWKSRELAEPMVQSAPMHSESLGQILDGEGGIGRLRLDLPLHLP